MPPQAGEKKLCMSLCAMSLFSVICAVLMVYFTAIIYIPGANVIHSKIQGKNINIFFQSSIKLEYQKTDLNFCPLKLIHFFTSRWEKVLNNIDGKRTRRRRTM